MTGSLAERTEVVRRVDQAAAEQVHPNAVDGHASRERVIGLSQPAGQLQSSAAGTIDRRRRANGGDGQEAAQSAFAAIARVAANAQSGIGRPAILDAHHQAGIAQRVQAAAALFFLAAAFFAARAEQHVGALEDAGQGVILLLSDGIELVIVAAGAHHR